MKILNKFYPGDIHEFWTNLLMSRLIHIEEIKCMNKNYVAIETSDKQE